MLTTLLRRSIVTAALIAGTIAGTNAVELARMARPRTRRPLEPRPDLPEKWSPQGENLAWKAPYRQPLVAGRVRQPRLHQHRGRRSRAHPGAAGRARCRDRQAALGAALQHLPERRAAASRRLGVARGGSGHRQHLRLHRRRAAVLRLAGRQAAVGSIAARGLRRGHDARRPHDLADRRRRPGHPQYARARVGRPQSPGQSLLRLRQAHRPDGLGQLAAGAPLRHQLLDADRRRSAAGPRRSSSAAPTARTTRCASTPARRSGRWK